MNQLDGFYRTVVGYLEANVNYPKWTDDHPGTESIAQAIADGTQYICMDGDRIVGAVRLSENPEGFYEAGEWSKPLKEGEYLAIHALAVHPGCARRGIGSYLVKECIGKAKHDGYQAIRLDVVPGNYPAADLYQKMGFQYAGTKDLRRDIEEIPVFDLYELNL